MWDELGDAGFNAGARPDEEDTLEDVLAQAEDEGGGLYAGVFNEQTGLFERTGFLGREAFKRDMLSGFTGWRPLEAAGWRTMCLRKFNHPKDSTVSTV